VIRATTCLENLEMSRNLTAVRDFANSQGVVSKKNLVKEKWPKVFIFSCIFAYILDFAELVHFILVSDHVLLHSYPHH